MTDVTMTDDGTTTSPTPAGDVPRRTDKRGLLHMLHDELGKALGVPKDPTTSEGRFGPGGKTVGDIVDDAVASAPAPGTPASDY